MQSSGIFSIAIIIANVLVSYRGFKDRAFYDKYSFKVDHILLYKDYKRLVTSGFLHVNWTHLIFNMIGLYFFSFGLEGQIGGLNFIIIYFAGLIGGDLLSLLLHKDDGGYSSVGASGAIAGVMFTTIALAPGMQIWFLPAWIFGLAYMLYSIYGIRSNRDNIGHDSHLGGALVGMTVGIIMYPEALVDNLSTILIISLPAIIFLVLIIKRPSLLLVTNLFYNNSRHLNLEDRYNVQKKTRQKEIDDILEKIHKQGINSLTKKEKMMLQEFSQ